MRLYGQLRERHDRETQQIGESPEPPRPDTRPAGRRRAGGGAARVDVGRTGGLNDRILCTAARRRGGRCSDRGSLSARFLDRPPPMTANPGPHPPDVIEQEIPCIKSPGTSFRSTKEMPETKHLQERLRRVSSIVRLAKRCENACKLKAQLIVYSCLINTAAAGTTSWITFENIERCVETRLKESSQQLPKPLKWILLEAVSGRLIEESSEGYRLTSVGVAAVADHIARIQRHDAMRWEEKLHEAQYAFEEFGEFDAARSGN